MEQLLARFRFTPDSEALLLSLAALGVFLLILLLAILYYRYTKIKSQYNSFKFLLSGRDIPEWQLKKLFRYLRKRDIEPSLILESEQVVHEAAAATGIDEEELLKRLGFDKESLLQDFLKRQEELRKKWNAR